MTQIAEAMRMFFRKFLGSYLHTCEPGVVEKYDPSTKRAKIRPLMMSTYTDGTSHKRPLLLDVPIRPVSAGGYMIHLPVKKGDVVLVIYTKGSLGGFKRSWGKDVEVEEGGNFSVNNAIAIPWGTEDHKPISGDGIVLQSGDGNSYIHLERDSIVMKVGRGNVRLTDGSFKTWRG